MPVVRRRGDLGAGAYTVEETAGGWRLRCPRRGPDASVLVRARAPIPAAGERKALRDEALARGSRDGAAPAEADSPRLRAVVRYARARGPVPGAGAAWLWRDGLPSAIAAPGLDVAPESGTLVVAYVPGAP